MSRGSAPRAYAKPAASAAERLFPFAAAALFLWLLAWIRLSWPYTLDDALIHLRYADHLLHQHHITYDGVHDSFGTSSLLYVSLLAVLRTFFTSPLLPRIVSSLVYVLLFAVLAISFARILRRAGTAPVLWLMATALLAVLVEPSAARWLNDGMETCLVFLDALLAVLLLRWILHTWQPKPSLFVAAFLYGLLTALLRIELMLLVSCVSVIAFLEAVRPREHQRRRISFAALVVSGMPLLGGAVAAGFVLLTMHTLLPDTAIAKAFGSSAWNETFTMGAITLVSSFSFGIGLLLLWIGSLAALIAYCRPRLSDLCANALLPVMLVLSALRGQQIQGIRYFGWTLFFSLLWNLLRSAESSRGLRPGLHRVLTAYTALILIALMPAAAWEGKAFLRLFQGRASALNTFREQNLSGLKGKLGIAEDVGFVGYFTQGDICDPYGLINGRALARLTYQPRFDRCMSMHPVFAFGSETFLQRVHWEQSLADWFICGSYRFDNVRTPDLHYLVVAPNEVSQVCPRTAQPAPKVLPAIFLH